MPYGDLPREEGLASDLECEPAVSIWAVSEYRVSRTCLRISICILRNYSGNLNGGFANSIIMSVVFGRRSRLRDPDLTKLLETEKVFVLLLLPNCGGFVSILVQDFVEPMQNVYQI